jgi:RHS repeat-associated protein
MRTGNVHTQTDVYGNKTTYTYDGGNRLLSEIVTNSAGQQVSLKSYTYNQAGEQLSETDGTQTVTTWTYDAAGRVASQTVSNDGGPNPILQSLGYTYDQDGNVSTMTDLDGNVTSYGYDGGGRVNYVRVTDHGGIIVSEKLYSYDWLGNQWTETDALSMSGSNIATSDTTQTTFNAGGQMLTQTIGYGTAAAALTRYAYDEDVRLSSVTDPDGNVTSYTYDAAGNKLTVTTPLGQTRYTYDDAGQLIKTVDADGRTTNYVYNAAGQMTSETWVVGSTVTDTLTWTYDKDGRMLTASNSQGTYTFSYTAAGQVASVSEPFGVSLSFGYDLSGNRTSVNDSFGWSVVSGYAGGGELTSRTLNNNAGAVIRVDASYDQDGNLQQLKRSTNASGTQGVGHTNYVYDDGRTTSIADYNTSGMVDYFTSAYNVDGQLTQETDSAIGSLNQATQYYGYDATGQLTAVYDGNWNALYLGHYDANGNRTSGITPGPDNKVLSDGTWNYTYDAEGNEISRVNIQTGDTWSYGYDNANHLIAVGETTTPTSGVVVMTAQYKYDVFGNRVETDVYKPSTGTVTTKFAYDGWNPAKAGATGTSGFDVWGEMNTSGILTARYLDGDGIDQVFGRFDTLGAFWMLADHLGSVRTVLNGGGGVQDELTYDAFGNVTAEANATYRGRYTYTSQAYDTETGLLEERARFYQAATGRWMSQDPMGFDAGDSNLYRYVNNRPTTGTDPSGLSDLSRQTLPDGTVHLYYESAWTGTDFIGTLDRSSSMVIRGNYAVPYDIVEKRAKAWTGAAPTTNAWFQQNGTYIGKGAAPAAPAPTVMEALDQTAGKVLGARGPLSQSFDPNMLIPQELKALGVTADGVADALFGDIKRAIPAFVKIVDDVSQSIKKGEFEDARNKVGKYLLATVAGVLDASNKAIFLDALAKGAGLDINISDALVKLRILDKQTAATGATLGHGVYQAVVWLSIAESFVRAASAKIGVAPEALERPLVDRVAPSRRARLVGGSAQRQAYIEALQAEGAQNYQFIRAAGQQYSEQSCVPGVLQQRLGSSPEMARMVELADRQGGYTLEQARNFLANNELVPAGNMRLVDSISMQDLATRATQANGRTTTVLNVRGTSGPHAVGVQGWRAVDGVPCGAFRIHDPLTGTEYWLSGRSLQQRVTGPNLGSALLID